MSHKAPTAPKESTGLTLDLWSRGVAHAHTHTDTQTQTHRHTHTHTHRETHTHTHTPHEKLCENLRPCQNADSLSKSKPEILLIREPCGDYRTGTHNPQAGCQNSEVLVGQQLRPPMQYHHPDNLHTFSLPPKPLTLIRNPNSRLPLVGQAFLLSRGILGQSPQSMLFADEDFSQREC